jgi:hypothetical protein
MHNYTKTDIQLHWLCQIIAKANRTFVPKKADDSHTSLYFDALGNRVMGRWISTEGHACIFTLNLANQQVEVLNAQHQVVAAVETIAKVRAQLEAEISALLPRLGLAPEGFTDALHYEIPAYDFADKPIPLLDATSIDEWKHYRQLANEACSLLLGNAGLGEEIRIWPHHFDTGIYFKLSSKMGIGFGLAMEDAMAGAPYFYMSAYPAEGTIDYKNVQEGEAWRWEIGEYWKGAILPIDQLENKSLMEQQQLLKSYLREAFGWFLKQ